MTKIMLREKVEPEPRKAFTKKQRAEMWLRDEGRCGICGEKIIGAYEIDHILERDLRGAHAPENWRICHPACHQKKTSERAPVLAKTHRLADEHFNGKKPSKRPLKGRGFSATLSKGFDGIVRPKRSSRPFPKTRPAIEDVQ